MPCHVLSRLASSCLVSSRLVLSCRVVSCRVVSGLVWSGLVLPCGCLVVIVSGLVGSWFTFAVSMVNSIISSVISSAKMRGGRFEPFSLDIFWGQGDYRV